MTMDYILASHNSWSYLRPKKWWMRLLRFTARCQRYDIGTQFIMYDVRGFDLRVRFDSSATPIFTHGIIEYEYSLDDMLEELQRLNIPGTYIRVILEVRNKKSYTSFQVECFKEFCAYLIARFPFIKFWGGSNLYNHNVDFEFECKPTCEEKYASVCKPRLIDDWWPWLFAWHNNHAIRQEGTDKGILMIDFVNIK